MSRFILTCSSQQGIVRQGYPGVHSGVDGLCLDDDLTLPMQSVQLMLLFDRRAGMPKQLTFVTYKYAKSIVSK